MCRPWPDDFAPVDAFSTDQSDVRAYAQACVPVVLSAIRDAEERGRLAAAELFDRIGVIAETPTGCVSDEDRALYRAVSAHFEPIGQSVLPNWKAMAAAIRAAGERESEHG